jgi:hypothetical protein
MQREVGPGKHSGVYCFNSPVRREIVTLIKSIIKIMKKPTIVAFMLMTCILLNGQEKKKEIFVDDLYGTNTPSSISGLKTRTIGDELQLYSRHYYTGFGTSLLGTGLLLVGYNLNTNESGKGCKR